MKSKKLSKGEYAVQNLNKYTLKKERFSALCKIENTTMEEALEVVKLWQEMREMTDEMNSLDETAPMEKLVDVIRGVARKIRSWL